MPWKKGNRLHAVSEPNAQPEIRAIYADIRQKLGIPHVHLIFQVYAAYPGFLALHWKLFGPIVDSGEFFHLAERLRADAYTRAHNYFEIVNLSPRLDALHFSDGLKQEMTDVIELFVYSDPLLLLISAAQQQAFDGAIGTGRPAMLPPVPGRFTTQPVFVDEQSAEPDTRRIFEEIRQASGLPTVSHDFQALARFPDFLRIYWDFLQPLLASPLYRECQHGIHESAWTLARELPGTIELTLEQMTAAGMQEDDVASIVRITQAFTRGLSGSLLNIVVAKISTEGGNQVESIDKEQITPVIARESTPNRAA
jgi:hypothetical protein